MKKLLMIIPLIFLFCFIAGCQQGEKVPVEPKTDVEADIQAIKDLIVEFNAVFNSADIDKILPYYADDVVRIPSNSPATVGKDAIRASYEQMFTEITIQEEYVVEDVQVDGDLAVAHVTFTYIATPKGGQDSIKSNGNEIMALRKQDNSTWKFIYLIWSDERLIYPDQAE